jgi:hypothetical protein
VRKIILILNLIFVLCSTTKATPHFYPHPVGNGLPKYGFSYGASGVISFFKVDTRISEKAIPRLGGGATFKMEFYPAPSIHIQVGMEILSQACAFNSYYFAPGYSLYYDKSYGYTHTLRTAELYIPILVRIGFTPAEGNLRTIFYVIGGYAPKIFLGATTNIVQNSTGKGIWGGGKELTFENYLFSPTVGSVLIGGFGCDKRLGFKEKFITFQVFFRYNFSRFQYDLGRNNENFMMLKNYCINLQVGYRFGGGGKSGG